jgi:uncharacterized membrane protein
MQWSMLRIGLGVGEGVSKRRHARRGPALRRVAASLLVGLVAVAVAAALGGSWSVAIAIGWDASALLYLLSVWLVVARLDAGKTARVARLEDGSVAAADVVLISAAVASLVAVAFILVDAAGRGGWTKGGYIALAVSVVVAAWASVHTVYMLRYARLYYADPTGGIDFHADDAPDYLDLAYVALTNGMTFQVSDTDLTAKSIRRTAVKHALLSYVFGAVIVAIMINIVGSLASAHH